MFNRCVSLSLNSRKHVHVFGREDDSWWLFPGLLLLVKCVQARMIDNHIANLEIQDTTLYSTDPTIFWES
jgi:hypothetical protein